MSTQFVNSAECGLYGARTVLARAALARAAYIDDGLLALEVQTLETSGDDGPAVSLERCAQVID